MQIKNHLLFNDAGQQVTFKQTPNKGGRYTPSYLIMHYTAATTAKSAINWFLNPVAQASAHLLIDQNGDVTQFAPFNTVTWHAGRSEWRGLNGLNQHSIGIELVNGGRLLRSGSKWICPVDRCEIPDDEVVMGVHKNETKESPWHEYSSKQLEVAVNIAALLVKTYGLKDVLGHEDIAPIRKSDPGPAFPMSSFRSKAMGRKDETLDEFKTSAALNIRSGPSTTFPAITVLPPGISVVVLKTETTWSFVDVQATVNGIMDLQGWVASKFLTK